MSESPVHILIAEDSPTQAERLRYTLERNGYLVTPTTNGRQALESARANPPTLIISDILMPEMNGYELCHEVKADPKLKQIPVILVTTLADPQDVIRALECRADNFIVKPYDEQYLLSRIQFVLLNYRMQEADPSAPGVEIHFGGQRHFIVADRLQILNLLLSTYDAAIQRNHELTRTRNDLRVANASLESANRELEAAIEAERKTHQALKSAQSQLVQAEKLAGLGQMVAGVAHEINNPLAFVLNNVWVFHRDLQSVKDLLSAYRKQDAIISEHCPEAATQITQLAQDIDDTLKALDESLDSSQDGLKRIEQIVKDLKDFARLDRGGVEDADINAGIQSTLNIIAGRARQKEVRLDVKLSSLPSVTCHPAKINQVIMNLVSNAIDACDSGGVVTVQSRSADNRIEIEVADTGSGIDPQVKDRIFDPFFTTKPQGQGMGLGLSISYAIIQDHQGRIDVHSVPDQGSRFIIHLPVQSHPRAS